VAVLGSDPDGGELTRPCREDLDVMYVVLTRAEAVLGGDDGQPLVREIREVYEGVCAQADLLTLRRHQQEQGRLRKRTPTPGLG
jgi:hypothetical protein